MYDVKCDFVIGDKIVYSCATAKNLTAEVIGIDYAKNAANKVIPWITVEFYLKGIRHAARLAAIPTNIAMMKIRKVRA